MRIIDILEDYYGGSRNDVHRAVRCLESKIRADILEKVMEQEEEYNAYLKLYKETYDNKQMMDLINSIGLIIIVVRI